MLLREVADHLWTQKFPLSVLGGCQNRVVTVIRLSSGQLIIHSTAPFVPADLREISSLGHPQWIVDAMLRHDTFSREGREAFPNAEYLVPEGFPNFEELGCRPLLPVPPEWDSEVEVLLIEGMPAVKEHVFLHRPSRTLIVADLVFNFHPAPGWTGFCRKTLMGVRESPDSARLYPLQIKNRDAYDRSIGRMLSWDFDRIIVGHDTVVPSNGRDALAAALKNKGMLPALPSENSKEKHHEFEVSP